MRKHALLTAAAAAALLTCLPMTLAAAAPAAAHDVLTTTKVGGPNVGVGAVLSASLSSGAKATFVTGTGAGVTCSTGSFSVKVTKNPTAPGTATESLTTQKFSSCTVHGINGARSVKSVAVDHLPYTSTISDSSGDPVTVSKSTTTITLNTVVGTLTCIYASGATVHGTASNTSQTISFSKQTFTLTSGPRACPSKGSFSATFGPVVDTSVSGSPHVFLN